VTCFHSPGDSWEPAVICFSPDQVALVIAENSLPPPLEGEAKRYLFWSGPRPKSHWKLSPPFHLTYVETVTLWAPFRTPPGIRTYGEVVEELEPPDILKEPPSTPVPKSGVRTYVPW